MSKTVEDLRAALFETLDAVKAGTMDVDRARAVSEVAGQIIQTAKVEIEHLKVIGGEGSTFLTGGDQRQAQLPNGIGGQVNGVRVHRLQG